MSDEKRIVLVGYPGSGKTMLAIGLSTSNGRKGSNVTAKAQTRLSELAAKIETDRDFPMPTQLLKSEAGKEDDIRRYPFSVTWHGATGVFEIQDYAGERAGNAEYHKEFVRNIIGEQPFGVVLLLNPGMELFKPDCGEDEIKRRLELARFYKNAVEIAYERGCRHFVIAVTASDRIRKGLFRKGDLRQKGNIGRYNNFKLLLHEIRLFLRNIRKAHTRKDERIDYKVVPVTVTGHLRSQEKGDVHLAKGNGNSAADPFLWMLDPWRMRIRLFLKRLMWGAVAAGLFFAALYAGFRVWNSYRIKGCLNRANDALANFDTEAPNFDKEKGMEKLKEADSCLKEVNEAWFIDDADRKLITERLPGLLGTLMTNQVRLACYNLRPPINDYTSPTITLKGRPELDPWPYWERSPYTQSGVWAAAAEFRESETERLRKENASASAKYLVNDQAPKITTKDSSDRDKFIEQASECLMHWDGSDENLRHLQNELNRIKEIPVQIEKADLKGKYDKAEEMVSFIKNGRNSLQTCATELFKYLSDCGGSPYRWLVLEAARERFNEGVSNVINKDEGRREGFDDVFLASRKLHMLPKDLCNETTLGDNALYWLNPTNGNGITYSSSKEWLCYTFSCDGISVRTDHKANNPSSEEFKRNVDANLKLSFDPQQSGFPKDVGGDWLIKNEDGEGAWTPVPNSAIGAIEMRATSIFEVTYKGGGDGEEDWTPDLKIGWGVVRFWPSWDSLRWYDGWWSGFIYDSDKKYYPNKAIFMISLVNPKVTGGPGEAFKRALEMVKENEPRIKVIREKEVNEANRKLKGNGGKGN